MGILKPALSLGLGFLGLGLVLAAQAAPSARTGPAAALHGFDSALQDLAARVSQAVVQVQVAGYGPVGEGSTGAVGMFARQRSIGSGVILDPEGYILTNAHVVEGAQHIGVVAAIDSAGEQPMPYASKRVYPARLVGLDKDTDLALLKIEAKGLPTLPLGDARPVRPGALVLAVGSPEGLRNSVTTGIISSVARQPSPEMPMEYLQTDAPINHGNSGGPLVDMEGFVVGLNTFILSEGGGSEGLGFAIPARTLRFVYERLKKTGRVTRVELQAYAQTITPGMAAGLGLAQDWGVVISDVIPGGPAESGGLQAGDVVLSMDGHPVLGLPSFRTALNLHPLESPIRMTVLRGKDKADLTIPALPRHNPVESLASLVGPDTHLGQLGIFGADFTQDLASALPSVRLPSGVVVVALSPDPNAYTSELRVGDLIHTLNQDPVVSLEQLRQALHAFKSGTQGVLTLERQGKMLYVVFEVP